LIELEQPSLSRCPRARGEQSFERRALEQIVVKPTRQLRRVVDAALQSLGDVQQAQIHLQTLLRVAQKEALLEIAIASRLFSP
jgi:hypothetical protein